MHPDYASRPPPPRCHQAGLPGTHCFLYAWSAPEALVLPRHMKIHDLHAGNYLPGTTCRELHAGNYLPGTTCRELHAGNYMPGAPYRDLSAG